MLISLFLRRKFILKFIMLDDPVFLKIYQFRLLHLKPLFFLLKTSLKGGDGNLLLIQLLLCFL